jgi:anti-sigma regulatory factor (Ser/Thr protein kinase)
LERLFKIQDRLRDVPHALNGVEEFCRAQGLAEGTSLDLRLVAEEVLTNIVQHANVGIEGRPVELRLSASSGSLRMEFRDEGDAFNPLDAPVPDLDSRMEARAIGGLGVHLIRSLVDEARYAREGSVNVFVLIKHAGSTV